MSKDWHADCFKCSFPACDARLEAVGYIEEKGNPFCRKCYEREIAYDCGKCGLKIIGVSKLSIHKT
jgi:hypothetical protein